MVQKFETLLRSTEAALWLVFHFKTVVVTVSNCITVQRNLSTSTFVEWKLSENIFVNLNEAEVN